MFVDRLGEHLRLLIEDILANDARAAARTGVMSNDLLSTPRFSLAERPPEVKTLLNYSRANLDASSFSSTSSKTALTKGKIRYQVRSDGSREASDTSSQDESDSNSARPSMTRTQT